MYSFSDVNECRLRPDICGAGTCLNSDGGYSCLCPPGFVHISGSCVGKRIIRRNPKL